MELPFRGTQRGWGKGPTGILCNSAGTNAESHSEERSALTMMQPGDEFAGEQHEKTLCCGRQQAAHEPAACPGSKDRQEHPRLYEQQHIVMALVRPHLDVASSFAAPSTRH